MAMLGLRMPDKVALELIGLVFAIATVLVVGAGGFAVQHQLAAESQHPAAVALAQLPSGVSPIKASIAPPVLK
jgi:hypothetical protein